MYDDAPRPTAFAPFLPEDFWLFMDAKRIRTEHRTRGQNPDSDHVQGNRRHCDGCQHMAMGALLAYAGRATRRGWNRDEGLRELEAHPATYDSMVKEGLRREGPAAGRLAKAYDAAFGAVYEKALTSAHDEGRLSVPVRAAQELLGFAIEMVQDQTSVIEHGQMLAWGALEERLANGPYALPPKVRSWHIWEEIEDALGRVPRAASMLDDHVYRHCAAASRQTASHHRSDEDGSELDPIDRAESSHALTAQHEDFDLGITARVAERLVRRCVLDVAAARAEAARALADRFGPDVASGPASALLDGIAGEAIEVARRELAILDAAGDLMAVNTMEPVEVVRAALASRGVEHPYDLTTENGREWHQRWLDIAVRDARHRAQDQRLGTGTR